MDEERRVLSEENSEAKGPFVEGGWAEDHAEQASSMGRKQTALQPKWVIAKLVIGILSIILFVFVMLQSCAAGLGNALAENGEVGGSAGFICAINFLISGIIAIAARKSVKKSPMIVATVFLWLSFLFARMMAGSYTDLNIWGFLSFVFGVVYLLSVMRTRKQHIISIVAAALVFLLAMAAGGATGGGSAASGETSSAGTVSGNGGQQKTEDEKSSGEILDAESKGDTGEENNTESETAAEEVQAASDTAGAGNDDMSKTSAAEPGSAWEVGEGKANTYTDSIGTDWVEIAVPVVNTGSENLYLSAGSMDLEDAEGHLVDSRSLVSVFPEVIKPGETAWYYDKTMLDEMPDSDLTIVPHVDVETAKVDCIRYEVSDVSFTDAEYGGVKITGRVENTTTEDGTMTYVVVFMYDEDMNFIGSTFTILTEELKAGEKAGFSTVADDGPQKLQVQNIANYRIYAYPEQFQF